jgi:hypothetical protein
MCVDETESHFEGHRQPLLALAEDGRKPPAQYSEEDRSRSRLEPGLLSHRVMKRVTVTALCILIACAFMTRSANAQQFIVGPL